MADRATPFRAASHLSFWQWAPVVTSVFKGSDLRQSSAPPFPWSHPPSPVCALSGPRVLHGCSSCNERCGT